MSNKTRKGQPLQQQQPAATPTPNSRTTTQRKGKSQKEKREQKNKRENVLHFPDADFYYHHELQVHFFVEIGVKIDDCSLYLGPNINLMDKVTGVTWQLLSSTANFCHYVCSVKIRDFLDYCNMFFKIELATGAWGILENREYTIANGSVSLYEVRYKDADVIHMFVWSYKQDNNRYLETVFHWIITNTSRNYEELCGFIGCLRRHLGSIFDLVQDVDKIFEMVSDKFEATQIFFVIVTVLGLVEKNFSSGSLSQHHEIVLADPQFPSTIILDHLPNKEFYDEPLFPQLLYDGFHVGVALVLRHNITKTTNLSWIHYLVSIDNFSTASRFLNAIHNSHVCPSNITDNFQFTFEDIVTTIDWNESNTQFLTKILERAPNSDSAARCLSHLISNKFILTDCERESHIFAKALKKYIRSLDFLLQIVLNLHKCMPNESVPRCWDNLSRNINMLLEVMTDIFKQLIISGLISFEEVKSLSENMLKNFNIDQVFLEELFDGLLRSATPTMVRCSLNYLLHTNLVYFISFHSSFIDKAFVRWFHTHLAHGENNAIEKFKIFLNLLQIISESIEFVKLGSVVVQQLSSASSKLMKTFDETSLKAVSALEWIRSIKSLAAMLFGNYVSFVSQELQNLALKHVQDSVRSYAQSVNIDENDLVGLFDYFDSPIALSESEPMQSLFFNEVVICYIEVLEKRVSRERITFHFFAPFHRLFRRLLIENEVNLSCHVITKSSIFLQCLDWVRDTVILPILSSNIQVNDYLMVVRESQKVASPWTDVVINYSSCLKQSINDDLLHRYSAFIDDFDKACVQLATFLNFLFTSIPKDSSLVQELTQVTNNLEEITQRRLEYTLKSLSDGVWDEVLRGLRQHAAGFDDMSRSKVFTSLLKNNFLHFHSERNDVLDIEEEEEEEEEEREIEKSGEQMEVARSNLKILCADASLKTSTDFQDFLAKLANISNMQIHDICAIWKDDFVFETEYCALAGSSNEKAMTIFMDARDSLINLSKLALLKRHAGYFSTARQIMMGIVGVQEKLTQESQDKLKVFEHLSRIEFERTFEMTVFEACEIAKMWQNDMNLTIGDSSYDVIMGILEEVSQCSDLMEFVRELNDDSVINFVDMIEEHSENAVRAETITEFDTARRFLRLALNCQQWAPLEWLKYVKECGQHPSVNGMDKLPGKLHTCRLQCYALRDVFHSVAKREESTKKLVKKMLASGHIFFCRTEDSQFRIVFSFESNGVEERRDQSSIEELRSRALLLVNSSSKLVNILDEDRHAFLADKEHLESFIILTNQMLQIASLLNELISLGHFAMNIPLLKADFSSGPLTSMEEHYTVLKDAWSVALIDCRQKYHYMNYFFSDQIWTIYNFLRGKTNQYTVNDRRTALECLRFLSGNKNKWNDVTAFENFFSDEAFDSCCRKAISLLKFADQSMPVPKLLNLQGSCEEAFCIEVRYIDNLKLLAQIIENFYCGRDLSFVVDVDNSNNPHIPSPFFPDRSNSEYLFYCVYESDATFFPMLFSVMEQHGETFTRNQLLLCEEKTTLEEYVTFFQRALTNATKSDKSTTSKTYAVINIHSLSSNNRSLVFKALNFAKVNQMENNQNKLMFLVRSDLTGYMEGMKQLRKHQVVPLAQNKINKIVQSRCPNVTVISSIESGMGKSERCLQLARAKNKKLNQILVADNISRRILACEIGKLGIESQGCLHLNISNPNHMAAVELTLFELLFLGTSQFGTTVVHWFTDHDCLIEITDFIKRFQEVDILQYFKREEISWSIDKFMVHDDLGSDAQLVCNYLKLVESGVLHVQEIILPMQNQGGPMEILSANECQRLLFKYFLDKHAVSVNILQIFLKVFASQLREFSASGHFQLIAFEFSGTNPKHRTNIVETLLECAREFVTKSIETVKKAQYLHTSAASQFDENNAVDDGRAGILRWEDDNQLMFAIADGALTLLYRNIAQVPKSMQNWIKEQRGDLPDYFNLTTTELREQLSQFCGLRQTFTGKPHYVLTPDNFLKITMMLIRVQAGIPIIIMGEAGCGKTSLIRFAGAIKGAIVQTLSIHAGITRKHLETFLIQCIQDHQRKRPTELGPLWIFLDEINTCDELGFLNSVICHRYLPGIDIPENVHFFAACNPFKKMNKHQVENLIGLHAAKAAHQTEHLIYRVKPLPSRMMDYIWDFGSLTERDELLYILEYWKNADLDAQLTPDIIALHASLVSASQSFIRLRYGQSAVSMRDVRRVNILYNWFRKYKHLSDLGGYFAPVEHHAAIILALAHCYRCRLPDVELRMTYDEMLSNTFHEKRVRITRELIQKRIAFEQEAYIRAMNVDVGIAMNLSLTENVFVLLVCILNRIPVFLVGKPGSSKSLAMTLITSNLRGKDSVNAFFKNLPEVKVISFQGSESSTSDGINKIFKKAEDLVEAVKIDAEADLQRVRNQVIPLVLLDEVGLAEISPYNPLKVLHAKLETENDELLDIAVVGISNWSLDASKMSRAIQLSRPEPNADELFQTAFKIVTSIVGEDSLPENVQRQLRKISKDFFDFYDDQKSGKHANFHGLRDFYSLCKHIGYSYRRGWIRYPIGILRNFGGLSTGLDNSAFKHWFDTPSEIKSSGMRMIQQNLRDPASRYLMVITKGDSILNALGSFLQNAGITEYRIVVGSKFKEDDSENYRYQMLSEIILSMEKGESLILVDLDGIYGSLYDMSNQNFTVIAGKKHCRVALGAYSNPMAHVHDKFKCIVVVDVAKVYNLDPPFLNRFEKQQCDFTGLLQYEHKEVAKKLDMWLESLCTLHIPGVNHAENEFAVRDSFIGYAGEDTVSSLVFSICGDASTSCPPDTILLNAKKKLMKLITVPGIIRIMHSNRAMERPDEVQELRNWFFKDSSKINLKCFLRNLITLNSASHVLNSKSIVTTFTQFFDISANLHAFIPQDLLSSGIENITIDKMALIGSQRTLASSIHNFYRETNPSTLYILQCDVQEDLNKLLLTKFLIDQEHTSYQQQNSSLPKYLVVIFSVSPELYEEDAAKGYNLFFSPDWEQIHIDNLEEDESRWNEVVRLIQENEDFTVFLRSHEDAVVQILEDNLMSTFSMLTYRQLPSAEYFQQRCEEIRLNHSFKSLLYEKIMQAFDISGERSIANIRSIWLLEIARNREFLYFSPSFYQAIQLYLKEKIQLPAVLSMYLLERYFALDTYVKMESLPLSWKTLFLNSPKLDVKSLIAVHDPQKVYEISPMIVDLRFPFSHLLFSNIEELEKSTFLEEMDRSESKNKTLRSIVQLFHQRIVQQHVVPFFSEAGVNYDEMQMDYVIEDVIRMFIQPHVYLQQVPSACNALQVLLKSISSQTTEKADAIILQLMLWNLSKPLIMAVKLVMFNWNSSYSETAVDSLDDVEELSHRFKIRLEDETRPEGGLFIQISSRLQMAQLLINFTKQAYPFSGSNESSGNFTTWANSIAGIFPTLLGFCRECRLDYLQFDPSQEDCRKMVYVYQALVPCIVGLRILMDLADLVNACVDRLSEEQISQINTVIENHMLTEVYEGVDEDMLQGLLQMMQKLVDEGLMPESDVTHYTFKILERYLLISLVDETLYMQEEGQLNVEDDGFRQKMDRSLFERGDYQTIVEFILKHQHDPPLGGQAIVVHFVEKLVAAIYQGEISADLPCFGSLNAFTESAADHEVLQVFESLFDHEGIKESPLVVAITDMVFTVLKQYFLDDDLFESEIESHCEIFENLVRRWSHGMEDVSLAEMIYGGSFLRWFMEEAHVHSSSLICQDSLNRALNHNSWSPIHFAVGMYWLKLFKKPLSELRIICGENCSLLEQYTWLRRLDWHSHDENLLTKLLPDVQLAAEQRLACEEAWNQVFDRLAPSNGQLKDLIQTMPLQELLNALIVVAFKKQCRTSQLLHQLEIDKITSQLPDTVDNDVLSLLQHVHNRFSAITAKDWTVDDVCIFLILVSFLISPHGVLREGIFGRYVHEAEFVRSSFVLGANSDQIASVLQHLRQTEYSYFKCPCGFVFVIDNCRQPMQRHPCPNCQRSLGGQDHAFDNTGQAPYQPVTEDKMGYCYLMDSINVVSHSERKLSPNEYRVVAFFVHCSLLGGLLLHPQEFTPLFDQVLVNANMTAIEYCWIQLTNHWEVLRKRLVDDGRAELLCGFMLDVSRHLQQNPLNVVPMNNNNREVLEEQIAGHLRPFLTNFVEISGEAVERYTDSTHTPSPFERTLEERDQPVHFLSKYLRNCKTPSFENLEQSFSDLHDGKHKFPVLAVFFKVQDKLDRIKWILPIVEWTNHVRTVLNFQITADDAAAQSVKQLAVKHPELDLKRFKKFVETWNHFYHAYPVLDYNRQMYEMLQNAECHDVILPEALSEDSPIIHSCIRIKGDGREAAYLLHQLAELQNEFLTEVLPFVKQYRGASEKFIQTLTADHQIEVVVYDEVGLWKDMTRFIRANIRYGHGRQLDCDWMKIEQLIIQRLIDGKAFLKSNIWQRGIMEEFRFKDELFKEQYRLFHHVRAIIPQEGVLPNYRNIVHDPRVRDQSFLQDRLLPALQSLLYVLQHQAPQASKYLSECAVADFASKHLDRSTNLIFAELQERNSEIVKVQLKQVETLYEVLEDHISDAVLGCVSNSYYLELSEDQRIGILRKLLPAVGGKEQELESSIRRFIVRYLRGTQGLVPHWPFSSVLDIIRWPRDIDMSELSDGDADLGNLLDSLNVGHAGSLLKLLHELIAEKNKRESVKRNMYQQSSLNSTGSTPTAAATNEDGDGNKQRRRRVMKNLSGFSSV